MSIGNVSAVGIQSITSNLHIMSSISKVMTMAKINFAKFLFISSFAMHSSWNIGKNYASAATAKIGEAIRAVFHFINATKNYSLALSKKVISASHHLLQKGCSLLSATAHFGWHVTKSFSSAAALKTASLAKGTWHVAGKGANLAIETGKRVGSFAAKYFSKLAHGTLFVLGQIKNGAVHGFQGTKNFFASHPKEALLVGGTLAISSLAWYAFHRLHGNFSKSAV